MRKKFNFKKFIINLFKNKFNIFIILISIIGIILGSKFLGLLPASILFIVFDIVMFLLNAFLTTGTKKQKQKKRKIFLIAILSMFILALIAIGVFIIIIIKEAPEFNAENLFTKEATILYDKDGEIITKLGSEKRVKITYEDLPQVLIDAIIATEDSRFYEHNGFDALRFLKASATQLAGQGGGGASTITMQVAKNAYTSPVSNGWEGIKRKFTDIYLSIFKIEKTYTKEEILEFYVNSYYMGGGAYGVEQACQNYFGKSVSEINLSEAAMIAGLFKGGNAYDPYLYPDNTEARRKTVLALMLRHGYISEEEKQIAEELTVDDIVIKKNSSENSAFYAYQSYIDTVVEEVKKLTKELTGEEQNPYSVPMIIYTNMDREKQEYLDDIMNGVTYKWENDVVQAGVVVTDTNTGAIVAIGGGRNKNTIGSLNYATMIKNQIGSTAKPLYDYAPAFEYLNWSPAEIIVDEKHSYSAGGNLNNWDGEYEGYMTLRQALKVSRNTPALKTFQKLSSNQIKQFVLNLNLSPEISGNGIHEAHSVGGYNGESPLSMAAAYAAFANGGTYIEPHSVSKIAYPETDQEIIVTSKTQKAMSDATAYMITDILMDTAIYTTGANKVNGVSYANKTGTTNFSSADKKKYNLPANAVNDLWVAGYSRDYAVALWYGYDKIYSEYNNKLSSGQNTRLFKAVIKGVLDGRETFTMPNSVVEVNVEIGTATPLLAIDGLTPQDLITTEVFKQGTEPTETSTRFAQLKNVKNLKAITVDNQVTLSWDAITSATIDEAAIRQEFAPIFYTEEALNEFIAQRLEYNNTNIGTISYDIYKREADGNLTLIANTSDTSYTTTVTEESTTFIVKTSYTIYKANASSGSETTVSATLNQSIITAQINGEDNIQLFINTPYTEPNNPVVVLENMIDVTDQAVITTTIEGPSSTIDTSIEGTYTIKYHISYNGYTDELIKTIQVKNS
ncbi:MAG: penicillin-binding protein [Firmicutes bacterium]|nr:penicillin-binding protein [Bacillota bacterium]